VPRTDRSRDARERARDALAAIPHWLEGALGRRLEGVGYQRDCCQTFARLR